MIAMDGVAELLSLKKRSPQPFNRRITMKYLMGLILVCFLTLAEFFVSNGDLGLGYTALILGLAAAILMLNAIAEDKARRIVDSKVLK
jgi:hypothetical protein